MKVLMMISVEQKWLKNESHGSSLAVGLIADQH
jgi:hypothetical protein